jgi:hypothetical protein
VVILQLSKTPLLTSTSDIADCTRAYELTRGLNDAQLPLCVSREATHELDAWLQNKNRRGKGDRKNKCGKCEDVQAMNQSREKVREKDRDNDWSFYENLGAKKARPRHEIPTPQQDPQEPVLPDKSKKLLSWVGHIFQKFTTFGPFSISWDTWKSSIWDLFTHAGFFTYVHHDGGGFCTYAFVRTGCKIWGIHRPRVNQYDIRSAIFDRMRRILRPHGQTDYKDHTDLYNVFLMKGDVL